MIVIFGATGFIGLYTAEAFVKNGYHVLGLGRNQKTGALLRSLGAEYLEFDITDADAYKLLPTENIEAVIVLAGLLPANARVNLDIDENAADYFKVNVIGIINILEYCRKNGIKKVIGNTSYSDVSGAWGKKYPITEDEPSWNTTIASITFSAAGSVSPLYMESDHMGRSMLTAQQRKADM